MAWVSNVAKVHRRSVTSSVLSRSAHNTVKSLKASPTIPIPLALRISAMRDSIRVPSGPILLTNERPTIIRVHDDTDEIRERHGDEFDNEFIHREITPY